MSSNRLFYVFVVVALAVMAGLTARQALATLVNLNSGYETDRQGPFGPMRRDREEAPPRCPGAEGKDCQAETASFAADR